MTLYLPPLYIIFLSEVLGNFIQGFSISLRAEILPQLTSPAFEDMGFLPKKYTCFGEGISPPLELTNTIGLMKAYILTFGNDKYFYWVVYSSNPHIILIPEDVKENDYFIFLRNDFGVRGYTPPCPNKRELYTFTLYILKTAVYLDKNVSVRKFLKEIRHEVMAKGFLRCFINP